MRNTIAQIDYQSILGLPTGKRLLQIRSGELAGRMLALFRESGQAFYRSYADAPYTEWSSPALVAGDASILPLDAVMAEDGTVWLTYVENMTEYLVVRKLSFVNGNWTVGEKAYVSYGSTFAPSIARESSGRLWISFGYQANGFYDIQVKSSADDGVTWGEGPTDIGETLRTGLYVPTSRAVIGANRLSIVYTGTLTEIYARWRSLSDSSWSDEQLVASGSDVNELFDAAMSDDGLLGIVFNSDKLYYREFDGANWGPQIALDSSRGDYPQIYFNQRTPVVVYLGTTEGEETPLKYVHRSTGEFSAPQTLELRADLFEEVLLYDASTGTYADCTSAAGSSSSSDIFHPDSGVMLSSLKDATFVGMSRRFRYLQFHLSTPGDGGQVSYAYWDGTAWKSFVPHGGSYNLDTASRQLALWDDLSSVPADWQKCPVDDRLCFWVRIETAGNFTTPPIGSRLTSRSHVESLIVRR